MKGDAEAFAIQEKAKAEAEQMAKKADAWKDFQEAAMVDMVLETMPKVGQFLVFLPSPSLETGHGESSSISYIFFSLCLLFTLRSLLRQRCDNGVD
jgi:hypothetical protein